MKNKLDLDEKYSEIVDALNVLNNKFSAFINGQPTDTIQTSAGQLKSLSGVIADLKRFQYVQRVVDHRLYADMISDDANLEDGLLVRIWGDTVGVNGLYEKMGSLDYIKVSYQDLYDLRDVMPNPWNYHQYTMGSVETQRNQKIASFVLPNSLVSVSDVVLIGKLNYTIEAPGSRGSYFVKYALGVTAAGTDETVQRYSYELTLRNGLDSGFDDLVMPYLKAVINTDDLNHNVDIWFCPAKDPSETIVPGYLTLTIEGFDPKTVKIITNSADLDLSGT